MPVCACLYVQVKDAAIEEEHRATAALQAKTEALQHTVETLSKEQSAAEKNMKVASSSSSSFFFFLRVCAVLVPVYFPHAQPPGFALLLVTEPSKPVQGNGDEMEERKKRSRIKGKGSRATNPAGLHASSRLGQAQGMCVCE